MVVITKVDVADPSLANPSCPSSILDDLKRRVASRIGTAQYKISHCVNYHTQITKLDFNVDRQTYVLLKAALDLAADYNSGCRVNQLQCGGRVMV